MNNKQMILMVLGCAIPLVIIALLPLFGYKGNYLGIIGIALMIIIHIGMMFFMTHDNCRKDNNTNKEQKNKTNG